MDSRGLKKRINVLLTGVLALNLVLWAGSRVFYARWAGVPPVPAKAGAVMMTGGDTELSYRTGALTLQALGDGGGQVTPLKDYNYKKLGEWFDFLDNLDPASEHVPNVAGYYFGSLHESPENVAVVVRYLARIGQNPAGEKWRWLAYAAMLAQHRMKDQSLALDIAYKLSHMRLTDGRELPGFAREYPAFILKSGGDAEKDGARKLMEQLLLTEQNPNEVNFIKGFLVEQLHVDAKEVDLVMKQRAYGH